VFDPGLRHILVLIEWLLDVTSGVTALAVSYFAFRYNRLVQSAQMNYIALGFALLGLGILVEGSSPVMLLLRPRLAFYLEYVLLSTLSYNLLEVLSYLVIALGYTRSIFEKSPLASLTISPGLMQFLRAGYVSNLVGGFTSFVLLGYIVFQAGVVYSKNRSGLSLLLLLGFSTLALSQVLLLVSVGEASPGVYFAGNLVRFLGFMFMGVFISGSVRVE